MYCEMNFRTKKELKQVVAAGRPIGIFQPGPFGQGTYPDGEYSVEGPHYPEPHRWYARVAIKDGRIVKVIG